MNHKASAAVVFLLLLVFISLGLAGGVYYLYQQEHTRSVDLVAKLEELNSKQKQTEASLQESKKMISDLQVKLDDAKQKIDILGTDLQQEKSARIEAVANMEQLKVDLEKQKGLRADIESKLTAAQVDLRKTQVQLRELETQRKQLDSKLKDLETKSQEVELGNIVVTPEAAPAPQTAKATKGKAAKAPAKPSKPAAPSEPDGKVLVLNREYNFVVLNLGSKDGVRIGDVFSVYHENKFVGDVKVEKVHDSMVAAGFAQNLRDKISEGDKVVQKGQ